MTSQTLSGTYNSGLTLTTALTSLTNTAFVNGGVKASSQLYVTPTLINAGYIVAGPTIISSGTTAGNYGAVYGPTYSTVFNEGVSFHLAGIVDNSGTIRNGVDFYMSGTVSNAAGGVITGGIYSYQGRDTSITNAGTIGDGIELYQSESLDIENQPGGTITAGINPADAAIGLQFTDVMGTIGNAGLISAYYGIHIFSGDNFTIANATTGTISGSIGIIVTVGETLSIENAGIILGSGDRTALSLNGSYNVITNTGTIVDSYSNATIGVGAIVSGGYDTFVNGAGGIVLGNQDGLEIGSVFALLNSGTISGHQEGVSLLGKGALTNTAGGLIENNGANAALGATLDNGDTVTIDNQGIIDGIAIIPSKYHAGSSTFNFTQSATGLIAGGISVSSSSASLDIAGTVTGGITLATSVANRLRLEPGFTIDGAISLGTGSLAIIGLGSGSSVGSLDIDAAHGGLSFGAAPGEIGFVTGARWLLEGDVPDLTDGVTLAGFTQGDTIELQDLMGAGSITGGYVVTADTFANNRLTITESNNATYTLDIVGSFATSSFLIETVSLAATLADPARQASLIEIVPCFAAGTRILTPAGERPVEALQPGDLVITAAGEDAAVIWVGRRRIDLRRHPAPKRVQPVRICAGALADGVPARDLFVSPEHALYIGGVLIPARHLVNHSSIAQIDVDNITYIHLELAAHAVIFAEWAPAETYLECGGRAAFEGGAVVALHPDFSNGERGARACAPVVESGAILDAARAGIAARSGVLDGRLRRA